MHARLGHPATRRHQRGSILVPAAVALLVMVILLGGAQLGYLFYAKRDMQKAADLAALTGAQVLHNGNVAACSAAASAASQAARANLATNLAAGNIDVSCWRWNPVKNTSDPRHLAALQTGERYNAVRVSMTRTIPALVPFMSGQALSVEAVAARPGEPVAAFSVGTTLLAANQKPGTLVNLLAAVGLNISQTQLVGYDAGLANVQITPSGLLKQLGINVSSDITVGELNSLLAAHVQALDGLLDAIVVAGGGEDLVNANVTLLNNIKAQLGVNSLDVKLGSTEPGHTSSLFAQITAPDGSSALNVKINALDLIAASIGVATGGHALQGALPIDILGLIKITPSFRVIEPAQIAIGGVGTTAYSAQIRLFLGIEIKKINVLNLLVVGVDLPIVIDVSTAQATLTDLCDTQDSSSRDLATIQVQSSLLDTCIGDLTEDSAFSSSQRCSTGLKNKQLVTLKIAGLDLGVNNKIALDPLVNTPPPITLHEGQQETVHTSTLDLGKAVKNVTDALLTALLGYSKQQGETVPRSTLSAQFATNLWARARQVNTCNPDDTGLAGFGCRRDLWLASLQLIQNPPDDLGSFVDKQPNPGLLAGVGTLLTGLTNTLNTLINGLLGPLLPNTCATLIGLGGTPAGCIDEISKSLASQPSAATNAVSNALLGVLQLLFSALQPVLDSIGSGILALVTNVVGLDLNNTDVRLLSLECNGKGVQLVY